MVIYHSVTINNYCDTDVCIRFKIGTNLHIVKESFLSLCYNYYLENYELRKLSFSENTMNYSINLSAHLYAIKKRGLLWVQSKGYINRISNTQDVWVKKT